MIKLVALHITCMYMYMSVMWACYLTHYSKPTITMNALACMTCTVRNLSLQDRKRMYTSKAPNQHKQCLVQSNFKKFNYVNE